MLRYLFSLLCTEFKEEEAACPYAWTPYECEFSA